MQSGYGGRHLRKDSASLSYLAPDGSDVNALACKDGKRLRISDGGSDKRIVAECELRHCELDAEILCARCCDEPTQQPNELHRRINPLRGGRQGRACIVMQRPT